MKAWLIALFTFCLLAVCTSDAQARGRRCGGCSSGCYSSGCYSSCSTVIHSAPTYCYSSCYSSCYSGCGHRGRRCR